MSWEYCNNPLYSDIEGVAATPNIINNTVTILQEPTKYISINYEGKPENAKHTDYIFGPTAVGYDYWKKMNGYDK